MSDRDPEGTRIDILRVSDFWPRLGDDQVPGVIKWAVDVGERLAPDAAVGSWLRESDSRSLGVDRFGVVRRLLVAEGTEVRARDPILEFESRRPTTLEFTDLRSQLWQAERALAELEATLAKPSRAIRFWLTRKRPYG